MNDFDHHIAWLVIAVAIIGGLTGLAWSRYRDNREIDLEQSSRPPYSSPCVRGGPRGGHRFRPSLSGTTWVCAVCGEVRPRHPR